MGLISSLVVAGMISAAAFIQYRPMVSRSAQDLVAPYGYDSGLPSLPSYKLDPDIAHNVC